MPEQVKGYYCECCGEHHELVGDKNPPKLEKLELFKCDNCGSLHEDEDEAKDCCDA